MVKGYSRTQIALHWVVMVLVFFQLVAGDSMTRVWWDGQKTGHVEMTTAARLHIIVGITILVLMLWRLGLRLIRGVPEVPDEQGPMVKLAGEIAHWSFYALLLLLPISGLLVWFGGVEALYRLHGSLLKALLYLLIAAHVGAAFWHQFIVRDGLLARMRKAGD